MARSEIDYWLALQQIPRLSVERKLALVENVGLENLFNKPQALTAFNLSAAQIVAIKNPNWQQISIILEQSLACHSQVIGFSDKQYPQLLKEIADPPLLLYVQGNCALLASKQLAIVGSRSATIDAREYARYFAAELTHYNLTITSGLALGIDGIAHQGALDEHGNTIAIVATGLDQVYPPRHKKMAKDIIAAGGAIVSEFPPGTPARAGHFPRRNRIISGLSLGVLVVEAAMRSGSLITARTALEQNREVFAMPGSLGNKQAQGCNWLIKQGAKLVDEIADITNELDLSLNVGLVDSSKKNITNNDKENLFLDPLLASVGYEITPVDTVVSRSNLPIEEVLSRLVLLELRGLVSAVPGGYQRLSKG